MRPTVADDIVTSLRASSEWIKDAEHYSWFGTALLQIDAANEIERLQEELNTTQELLARCYKLAVGHGPDFDVFDDWEEAIAAYEREATSRTIRYDGIPAITSEQVDQILKAIKETHRG
jgi:hypothetical protein